MRVLRLVGPDDDGTSVLLETDSGEVFSLPVDDRLRAASRADRAHLGQLDAALSGPLRPRDIQIRVRGGESPQELADQSGMPVERVMRFAYPVLAERTRVADEARRARARRSGDGHLVPFGDLVDARLAAHEIEPDNVGWDAFRRPDGGWTVTADVPHDDEHVQAKFSFSLSNRTVSALNDVAADLLSGRPITALSAATPESQQAAAFGRLSAVPDHDPDQPARRRRAFTHPLPISVDDELFDQDVFDQDNSSSIDTRVDFARSDVGRSELLVEYRSQTHTTEAYPAPDRSTATTGTSEIDAQAATYVTDALSAEIFSVAFTADMAADGAPDDRARDAGSSDAGSSNAGSNAGSHDAGAPDGHTHDEQMYEDRVPSQARFDEDTASDAPSLPESSVAAAPAAGAGRRGGRHGDKPRMPSWDDILLGVRRRPE